MIEGVGLNHFLILSGVVFFLGMYGFLSRRNMITLLMSLELMLNAVNINFVAFNAYLNNDFLQGHFFALFIIGVAAAEAALAIAIIVLLYRKFNSINIEKSNTMKH
ncbi:MAG: NADH-quinone oxidoreductase subunit NuoK [Vicingaceae bacterium]